MRRLILGVLILAGGCATLPVGPPPGPVFSVRGRLEVVGYEALAAGWDGQSEATHPLAACSSVGGVTVTGSYAPQTGGQYTLTIESPAGTRTVESYRTRFSHTGGGGHLWTCDPRGEYVYAVDPTIGRLHAYRPDGSEAWAADIPDYGGIELVAELPEQNHGAVFGWMLDHQGGWPGNLEAIDEGVALNLRQGAAMRFCAFDRAGAYLGEIGPAERVWNLIPVDGQWVVAVSHGADIYRLVVRPAAGRAM